MGHGELVLVIGALLFAAFCLGFVTHWLVNRLSHVSADDLGEMDRMAEALHAAEESRDTALAQQRATETRLRAQLAQNEAELRAAMEGLRAAREEAEALRRELGRRGAGG